MRLDEWAPDGTLWPARQAWTPISNFVLSFVGDHMCLCQCPLLAALLRPAYRPLRGRYSTGRVGGYTTLPQHTVESFYDRCDTFYNVIEEGMSAAFPKPKSTGFSEVRVVAFPRAVHNDQNATLRPNFIRCQHNLSQNGHGKQELRNGAVRRRHSQHSWVQTPCDTEPGGNACRLSGHPVKEFATLGTRATCGPPVF